jgi:hypothetical protein
MPNEHLQQVAAAAFQQIHGAAMPVTTASAVSTVKLTHPTLDDDQARAFQAFMIATGANGKTVGNGRTRLVTASYDTDIPQEDLYLPHYRSYHGNEAGVLTRKQRDAQDALGYVGLTDDGHIRPETVDAELRISQRQTELDAQRADQIAHQSRQAGSGSTGGGGTTKRI